MQPVHSGRRTHEEVDCCGLLQVFAKGGPDFLWDLEDSMAWEVWSWSWRMESSWSGGEGGENRLDRPGIKGSGCSLGEEMAGLNSFYCLVVHIERVTQIFLAMISSRLGLSHPLRA